VIGPIPEVSYHQTHSARDWLSILTTPYTTQNLQRKHRKILTYNVISVQPTQAVLFLHCLLFPLFCPYPVCQSTSTNTGKDTEVCLCSVCCHGKQEVVNMSLCLCSCLKLSSMKIVSFLYLILSSMVCLALPYSSTLPHTRVYPKYSGLTL
jgi:hypothetical protein